MARNINAIPIFGLGENLEPVPTTQPIENYYDSTEWLERNVQATIGTRLGRFLAINLVPGA
jgi:hypothetical protein